MDQLSEKRLAEIVAAGPDSITAADAGFLRARRSYLSEEANVVFKDVLKADVGTPEATSEEVPEEKPAKKSAK